MEVLPKADRIKGTEYAFDGWLGHYLDRVTEQWVKVVPSSNPGILQILRDRDRRPLRDLVPTPYRSWLRIRGVPNGSFSRGNPLRSVRPR